MPNNNLPPGSQMWARDLESRLARIETSANNLNTLIASSNNRVNSLLTVNEHLLHQTEISEASPPVVSSTKRNPITTSEPNTWVVSDPEAEASVALTTSSTGKVSLLTGAAVFAQGSGGCTTYTFTGVEISLAATGAVVRPALYGSGPMVSSNGGFAGAYIAGQPKVWQLLPNTKYRFRVRRGFRFNVSNPTPTAYGIASWQGSTISVTKLGL